MSAYALNLCCGGNIFHTTKNQVRRLCVGKHKKSPKTWLTFGNTLYNRLHVPFLHVRFQNLRKKGTWGVYNNTLLRALFNGELISIWKMAGMLRFSIQTDIFSGLYFFSPSHAGPSEKSSVNIVPKVTSSRNCCTKSVCP